MPVQSPEAAAERTQRHLLVCQELAELGMQLARGATAQVLAAQEPPADPTCITPASAQARADIAAKATLLFVKLSRAVRQAILLETRIASDHEATVGHAPSKPGDYRRSYLREVLHNVAKDHPEGLDFKREAFECLDNELARDKNAFIPDILATISEILNIVVTEDQLPEGGSRFMWPTVGPREPVRAVRRN